MALLIVEQAKEAAVREFRQLLHDLEMIPADKRNWRPDGGASSAHQIVAHCAEVYEWQAAFLRGEGIEVADEFPSSHEESLETEAVIRQMEEGFARVCDALDELAEEQLPQSRTMPWGEEMPVTRLIWRPARHAVLHDGQLTYIQLLLGDKELHRAG